MSFITAMTGKGGKQAARPLYPSPWDPRSPTSLSAPLSRTGDMVIHNVHSPEPEVMSFQKGHVDQREGQEEEGV